MLLMSAVMRGMENSTGAVMRDDANDSLLFDERNEWHLLGERSPNRQGSSI